MIPDENDARERRRAERARWPVARYHLGHEPADDLFGSTTPTERIAMMWPLAQAAWAIAGRVLPDYDRAHLPAVLLRPGTRRCDDDDT